VIIGSGAGGGTLARIHAEAGKKVWFLNVATGCLASLKIGILLKYSKIIAIYLLIYGRIEIINNSIRVAIILWAVHPSFMVQLILDCGREILWS